MFLTDITFDSDVSTARMSEYLKQSLVQQKAGISVTLFRPISYFRVTTFPAFGGALDFI